MTGKKQTKQTDPAPQDEPREEVVYKPMAVPEPTIEERMAAIEVRLKVTENWTQNHQRYHFGKEISKG